MRWQDKIIKVDPKAPKQRWADTYFHAVGMAGEAGEVLNLIKKHWRGDITSTNSAEWEEQVIREIADTAIYLEMLAQSLNTTVDKCVEYISPDLRSRGYMRSVVDLVEDANPKQQPT